VFITAVVRLAASYEMAGGGRTGDGTGDDRCVPPALLPATRAYATRRTSEGKTKKEIIRCLKRYIAREVYATLRDDLKTLPAAP
jgi:hypothetical protein